MRQLHKKAEADARAGSDDYLPRWNKANTATSDRAGDLSVSMAHVFGILAVATVTVWCAKFRGGFSWSDPNKDLTFNFHPVLMIGGFVFIHGEANLVYKMAGGTKNDKKLLHLLAQALALSLGLIGALAALKFHNDKGIDNFYSLHSWLGLLTIVVFFAQWLIGFLTFWYPGGASSTRAAVLPWHVYLGFIAFGLSLVTAETGLLEKLTFIQSTGLVKRFGAESMMVNSIGLLLVLFGLAVSVPIVLHNRRI